MDTIDSNNISPFAPERITLTFYDRMCRDFGISWYTKTAGTPEIRYISMPDGCADPEAADFSDAVRVPCTSADGMEGIQNKGVIRGLLPEKDYCYMVGDADADVWSRRSLLRRRIPHNDEYTFLFMSDTQDSDYLGTMWERAYADALKNYPDAAFLIHGGDIVDFGGYVELWEAMLRINEKYTMRIPMIQASGNHEYWRCYLRDNLHINYHHYNLDFTSQNTENGIYFAREFGDSLFIVLNSGDVMETNNELTETQMAWLEKELSSTDKSWRFAVIHNPLYSPGKYGSHPDCNKPALNFRRQLNGLFEKYKVSLCMCGHDHVYSKTYPIDGRGNICEKDCGTIHLMPGCGGIQDRCAIDDLPEEEAAKIEEYLPMEHGYSSYIAIKVRKDAADVFYHTVNCGVPESEGILKAHFTIGRRK